MNTILNTAVSPFVLILRRSGVLTEDIDYHLVRASMVIMFSADLVALSRVRPPGCKLVSRCFRMDVRRPSTCRVLG